MTPRDPPPLDIRIHYVPELHPDDVVTLPNGLRVTSVARTLIDFAEVSPMDELRAAFEAARERGLLDMDELRAARARVEWRPSLAMIDTLIEEFERLGPAASATRRTRPR